jgi:hypothetical protein
VSLKQLRVCPFWGPGKHPWYVGKRTAENGISSINLFHQSLLLCAEFNSKFNTLTSSRDTRHAATRTDSGQTSIEVAYWKRTRKNIEKNTECTAPGLQAHSRHQRPTYPYIYILCTNPHVACMACTCVYSCIVIIVETCVYTCMCHRNIRRQHLCTVDVCVYDTSMHAHGTHS